MAQQKKKEEKEKNIPERYFLETRIIIISEAVDSKLAQKIINQILILESEDKDKEIKVFINSPGGEVSSGFAIYDMLKFVPCPIMTLVTGLAASMGSILSLAGDPGRTFAFPHAKVMIHQPLLGQITAQATDLEIHANEILKIKDLIAQLYADRTGHSKQKILKDMNRDKWFTAEEALKYKLLDKIITSRDEL